MASKSLNVIETLTTASVTVPTIGDVTSAFRSGIPQFLSAMAKNLLLISTASVSPFLITQELQANDQIVNPAQEINNGTTSPLMEYVNMAVAPVGAVVSGFVTNLFGTQLSLQIVLALLIAVRALHGVYTTGWPFYLTVMGNNFCSEFFKGPVISHMAETAQPHLRGAIMATASFAMVAGQFQQLIMKTFLTASTTTYINCTLPLICIVLLWIVPESPQSLIMSNKLDKARKSLAWLRGWVKVEEIEPEFQEMLAQYKPAAAQDSPESVREDDKEKNLGPISTLSSGSITTSTTRLLNADDTPSVAGLPDTFKLLKTGEATNIADLSNVANLFGNFNVTSVGIIDLTSASSWSNVVTTSALISDNTVSSTSILDTFTTTSIMDSSKTSNMADISGISGLLSETILTTISNIPILTTLLNYIKNFKLPNIANIAKLAIGANVGDVTSDVSNSFNAPSIIGLTSASSLSNVTTTSALIRNDTLSSTSLFNVAGITKTLDSTNVLNSTSTSFADVTNLPNLLNTAVGTSNALANTDRYGSVAAILANVSNIINISNALGGADMANLSNFLNSAVGTSNALANTDRYGSVAVILANVSNIINISNALGGADMANLSNFLNSAVGTSNALANTDNDMSVAAILANISNVINISRSLGGADMANLSNLLNGAVGTTYPLANTDGDGSVASVLANVSNVVNISNALGGSSIASGIFTSSSNTDLTSTSILKTIDSCKTASTPLFNVADISQTLDSTNVLNSPINSFSDVPDLSNLLNSAVGASIPLGNTDGDVSVASILANVSNVVNTSRALGGDSIASGIFTSSSNTDLTSTSILKTIDSCKTTSTPLFNVADITQTLDSTNVLNSPINSFSDVPNLSNLLNSAVGTSNPLPNTDGDVSVASILANVSSVVNTSNSLGGGSIASGIFTSSSNTDVTSTSILNTIDSYNTASTSLFNVADITKTLDSTNVLNSPINSFSDVPNLSNLLNSAVGTTNLLANTEGDVSVASILANVPNVINISNSMGGSSIASSIFTLSSNTDEASTSFLKTIDSCKTSGTSILDTFTMTTITDSSTPSTMADISGMANLSNEAILTGLSNIPILSTLLNYIKYIKLPKIPYVSNLLEGGYDFVVNIDKFASRSFLVPLAIVTFAYVLINFTGTTILLNQPEKILLTLQAPLDPKYAVIVLTGANLIGVSLSISAVKYFGKRNLTFISLCGVGICSFAISAYSYFKNIKYNSHETQTVEPLSLENFNLENWIPLAILLTLSLISHFGLNNLPVHLVGELFSKDTRAIGTGVSNGITNYLNSLCNSGLVFLLSSLEFSGLYCFYGVVSFVGIVILHFILPETEGKSLEEIENHFNGTAKLGNFIGKIKKPLSKIQLKRKQK